MEIRQLEYFLMVSQAGSFTRAAERLFVSQPAVTNAVRSLEEELGIQLFDRGQKAVTLTPEGKIFHAHIQQVMHGIASTIEEINAIKDLQDGRLNFGLTALGGLKSFVALLRDYHEQYPNIRMVMREGTETELLDELMDEHIDMVLLTRAPKNNAIASYKLPREEILVCCGRRHPLHRRNSAGWTDIREETFIGLRFTGDKDDMTSDFPEGMVPGQILTSSAAAQTVKNLVAAGCGIALMPESLCEDAGDLAVLSLDPPQYLEPVLCWKKNRHLSKAAESFLEAIREE